MTSASRRAPVAPGEIRLGLRIDLPGPLRIGPGKIALLEQIAATGSISAAGRALGMSYRRAWELIEALNQHLEAPVVQAAVGGSGGGGARLTGQGESLVASYRALEHHIRQSGEAELERIKAMVRRRSEP